MSMFNLKCSDQSTPPQAAVQEHAPYRVHTPPALPDGFTSSLQYMSGKDLPVTFMTRVCGEHSDEKAWRPPACSAFTLGSTGGFPKYETAYVSGEKIFPWICLMGFSSSASACVKM